jgi:threonine aldolase
VINLYSDTQTRPSEGMRRAIATADVGDEQRREDPTTRRLEERVAELLGHEAGLFLPSGTMCNQIALRLHARPGGDELILDRAAPPIIAEVSVEQTTNMGGGRVWPLDTVHAVLGAAREHGLRAHMDGARLMNAVVASGVSAAEYAGGFDTAWLDFTKGLGAPVGAVLCGSAELIEEGWRWKQQMGGAMRQAGIVAAGCVYALDHNVERLAEDHEHAGVLAAGLTELGCEVIPPETNIVIFSAPEGFVEGMARHAIELSDTPDGRVRAVTHLDVSRADVDEALKAARALLLA